MKPLKSVLAWNFYFITYFATLASLYEWIPEGPLLDIASPYGRSFDDEASWSSFHMNCLLALSLLLNGVLMYAINTIFRGASSQDASTASRQDLKKSKFPTIEIFKDLLIWHFYAISFIAIFAALDIYTPEQWVVWFIRNTYDPSVTGFGCEGGGYEVLAVVALILNGALIYVGTSLRRKRMAHRQAGISKNSTESLGS